MHRFHALPCPRRNPKKRTAPRRSSVPGMSRRSERLHASAARTNPAGAGGGALPAVRWTTGSRAGVVPAVWRRGAHAPGGHATVAPTGDRADDGDRALAGSVDRGAGVAGGLERRGRHGRGNADRDGAGDRSNARRRAQPRERRGRGHHDRRARGEYRGTRRPGRTPQARRAPRGAPGTSTRAPGQTPRARRAPRCKPGATATAATRAEGLPTTGTLALAAKRRRRPRKSKPARKNDPAYEHRHG